MNQSASGFYGLYPKLLDAVWLLLWLVDRASPDTGIVSAAAPVSDKEISREFSCSIGQVKGWRRRLVREGFIKLEPASGGGYVARVVMDREPITSLCEVVRSLKAS